jgi:hypothetical protein
MNRKIILLILGFLLFDIGYSFVQHLRMPLYGDMAEIVIPEQDKSYYRVLKDPLGISVLVHNQTYSNPNRFFAHWIASIYFLNVPLFLQWLTTPVESVYLASAFAKIITQMLIILLLSIYISGTGSLRSQNLLLAAVLVAPLFQTTGFNWYMGIIDRSVIYTFFYAFPLVLLMIFYLPFWMTIYHSQPPTWNWWMKSLWLMMMFIITLNGPLNPGIILIVNVLILGYFLVRNAKNQNTGNLIQKLLRSFRDIPGTMLFFLVGISFLSLYSLYIGKNNDLSVINSIPLAERYSRIPAGLYNLVFTKVGLPLLIAAIMANVLILSIKKRTSDSKLLLVLVKWVFIFSFIYILLLPFGGYRSYRPNIIRYDTFIPITIGMILIFGATSYYLIRNLRGSYQTIYTLCIITLLGAFTFADKPVKTDNRCEKEALLILARSKSNIVALEIECPVMDWTLIDDYQMSERNAELFLHWKITDEKRLYYHPSAVVKPDKVP